MEEALASAMMTALRSNKAQAQQTELLRSILDKAPSARARLWDLLAKERERLGCTLAERLHCKAKDPRVILSARFALLVMETAADLSRQPTSRRSAKSIAKGLIGLVSGGMLVLPRMP